MPICSILSLLTFLNLLQRKLHIESVRKIYLDIPEIDWQRQGLTWPFLVHISNCLKLQKACSSQILFLNLSVLNTPHCSILPQVTYLVKNIWELSQFTEFYQVQPSHVQDPFSWLRRTSFQIQRSTAWEEMLKHTTVRTEQLGLEKVYFHFYIRNDTCLS